MEETEIEIGFHKSMLDSRAGVSDDPFSKNISDIAGIGQNVKRRIKYKTEKFLSGRDGTSSKQVETDWSAYEFLDVVTPPYDLKYLAQLYDISPYNYAAVNAKAANVVGLGYEFVESHKMKKAIERTNSENKKRIMREQVEQAKHDLREFLDSLNSEALFIESIHRAYIDYQATGNGIIEIGRNSKGKIGYVGSIPSSTIRVRRNRDGFVQITGNKAVFFRNFGDTKTPDPLGMQKQPNEIIHLKNYSPSNTYYGVPDIVSALAAVAGNEFATRYNLDFFEHRAAPRYVIIVKGAKLSDVSEQRLLEFFQSGLKGKNHRSIYIPLPGDEVNNKVSFEMKPIENDVQDASFDAYRKANRDEILMAHRTPITKIGIVDGASIALAKDADKTFKEQLCLPEQRILQTKINRIIAEFTDALVLQFNELSLTDEDTQSKIDERHLRGKVIVPAEIRHRMGLPYLEGSEEPLELSAQGRAEAAAQARGSRTRDQERANNASDNGADGARNAQGEGRAQA